MLILTVIFGTSTAMLSLILWAAMTDLKKWKERWDKANENYLELVVDYNKLGEKLLKAYRKLEEQESKTINPSDTHTYKVTVTHTHGDTQVFEHVHEIGKCEGYIELIGKDGKAFALVADNFRTLVKEDE